MVFPSLPFYQEEPTNNTQVPLPPRPPQALGGSHMSSVRPNSTSDRARLAKIPQPETPLNCPRCESTNTKFCYFNNYNRSQPRHFCKACRRYWTRGGALRNVPVGGGCRKNKRSKGSRSKSPATVDRPLGGGGSSSTTATSSLPSNSCTNDVIGGFVPSLHHLSDYSSGPIGLNFGGIPLTSANQWRVQNVQQFPFMAGVEPLAGLYGFDGSSGGAGPSSYMGGADHQIRAKAVDDGVSQMDMVKNEENHQGLNLARNFLGINNSGNNDQYWGGNAWSDVSGFTSSTSHFL